jgi:hypothetical protein
MDRHRTTGRRRFALSIAAVPLLAAGIQPVLACRAPPQGMSAQQQLASATDVSLARAVRATPWIPARRPVDVAKLIEATLTPVWEKEPSGFKSGHWAQGAPRPRGAHPVQYEFVVEKRWLGPDTPGFTIMGVSVQEDRDAYLPEADFRKAAFWAAGGGRLSRGAASCYLSPSFVIGERYVIFQGQPIIARSFEHVATVNGQPDPDDRWLRYVEEGLGAVGLD